MAEGFGLSAIFLRGSRGVRASFPFYAPTAPFGRASATGGAGGSANAKHLLLFTLTLHFGFAEIGVRGLCVFILCLVAKNEARKPNSASRVQAVEILLAHLREHRASANAKLSPQRALPFGFPWWEAGAIDISAPRQKCLSTFFLGCENVLRYRVIASGDPKIPLLQRRMDDPLPFGRSVLD